jgi:hypothetical protein
MFIAIASKFVGVVQHCLPQRWMIQFVRQLGFGKARLGCDIWVSAIICSQPKNYRRVILMLLLWCCRHFLVRNDGYCLFAVQYLLSLFPPQCAVPLCLCNRKLLRWAVILSINLLASLFQFSPQKIGLDWLSSQSRFHQSRWSPTLQPNSFVRISVSPLKIKERPYLRHQSFSDTHCRLDAVSDTLYAFSNSCSQIDRTALWHCLHAITLLYIV